MADVEGVPPLPSILGKKIAEGRKALVNYHTL